MYREALRGALFKTAGSYSEARATRGVNMSAHRPIPTGPDSSNQPDRLLA